MTMAHLPLMGSHYSCDPPEKRAKSAATLSFVPKGRIAAHGAASFPCAAQGSVSKGAILFHKREWPPFDPPRERTRGLPPRPRTLAAFILKSCTRCAIGCGVHGFAMNTYYSLPVATAPYYREVRVMLHWAADCLPNAALLRSPHCGDWR